ncbi:MAG: hypothetical protein IV105_09965 [Rhizobacter sp.]|nr:hypothetical protein [Rhizobacter sp.]
MSRRNTLQARRFCGAWVLCAALVAAPAMAQDAVRPEVGTPLRAAQELVRAGKFKEALAKVREADGVGGKTPGETVLIERMRMAAASGSGEAETAARSFEAISASAGLSVPDKLRMLESLTGAFYRAQNYGRAVQWGQRYFREGGSSANVRSLLIQSQYLAGDFAGAAKELTLEIQAAEKAGATPGEDRLKLLVNASARLKDTRSYVWALERLVTYHPSKAYWVDLLGRLQQQPNFSDRLALDVYRLSLATGSMGSANDYMEMAQLALQAGLAGEARQVVDKGFAEGVLGVGTEAERHQRLRELVAKRVATEQAELPAAETDARAAKDGTALANLGLRLVFAGDKVRGQRLLQEGLAKGKLKRADDVKLHWAVAQLVAGDTQKAVLSFKSVGGDDGTAELARLWVLHARRMGRGT